MRKIFLALTVLTTVTASAQLQVGVFGGIANYQGDLVERPFESPKPAFGITIGYPLSGRVTIRGGLTFAKVAGADSLNKQKDLRARNLSFQSPVTELSLVGEFNTFDMDLKSWSPYVFAGIAIYHFNPYTFDANGNKIFLQPLSTEGQGLPGYNSRPYALTQLALPFGGGIKLNISETTQIGLEMGLRKLFTDYLDDVSGNYADASDLFTNKGQTAVDLSYRGDEAGGSLAYPNKGETRGSPKYKDYYYFTGLHVTFQLPEGSGSQRNYSSRSGRNKKYGCPTVF